MLSAFRSHRLYVPAITTAVSAGLFFVYTCFYVAWQRNYANERAFRLLDVVSDQIAKRADNLKNVMAASLAASQEGAAPAGTTASPADYLTKLPTFRGRISEVQFNAQPCSTDRDGKLQLQLRDGDGFSVSAEFHPVPQSGSSCKAFVRATVDLAPELRERFHAVTDDYFDDIFIGQQNGQVLFQKNASGVRVADLNALLSSPEKPEEKSGANARTGPARSFAELSKFSSVADVTLGGAAYKLYIEPVPVFSNLTGTRLVVCGLWRTDRLQSEVVSLPYSVLIWFTLLLLTAFALGWPLLKIVYMAPSERLRRHHVASLAFSLLSVAALLSVIVLQWSYSARADEESKEQLAALADRIDRNVQDEIVRSVNFLNALDRDEFLHAKFRNQKTAWTGNRFLESSFFAHYSPGGALPDFDNIFWVDRNGLQQFKLTVQDRPTPRTKIAPKSYFQDVRDERRLADIHRDLSTAAPASLDSGVPGESRFRLDSTYSPNTGEFFVVLARPYSPPAEWTDVPPEIRSLTAEVMAARFASLIDPVVPTGYGFAVVDHEGLVQFHSSSARNQIENFFQESRQDAALKDLVLNGKSDYLKVNYMGKRQQIFVKPLPYLGPPAPALVVFRDVNYFATVNVACLLVFALLAAVLSFPLLSGFILYLSRCGHYLLEHIWPATEDLPRYVDFIAACFCLGLAFVLRFPAMKMDEMLLSICTIVVAAIALLAVRPGSAGTWPVPRRLLMLAAIGAIARFSPALLAAALYLVIGHPAVLWRLRGRAKRFPVADVYGGVVFCVLALVVVLPCFGLFQISYNTVNRLALETAQVERRDLLGHRQEEINRDFAGLNTDAPDEMRSRFRGFAASRLETDWDRYDRPVYNPNNLSDVVPADSGNRDISVLEPAIARWSRFLPSNRMGAEIREMALTGSRGGERWSAMRTADADDELLWLRSPGGEPEYALLGVYPLWHLGAGPALLLAALACLFWFWLRHIVRSIFPTEIAELPPLETSRVPARSSHHLLLIGPGEPAETTAAHCPLESDRLDLARLAAAGDWTLPKFQRQVVVVDHFEFDIENPETSQRKLKLLEQLVYAEQKTVILISAVDPIFYLCGAPADSASPDASLDRWAHLFRLFRKREWAPAGGIDLPEAAGEWVAAIREECASSAALRAIGREILEAHRHDPVPPARAQVVDEVLERAEVYYRVLWSTCARDERLVLYQLAQDGWANPKNYRAIQQLVRRKLVRKGSGYRIMNESFCSFVRNARRPEELARWEQEQSQSAWSAVKMGLGTALFLFGAWLVYAQQDTLQLAIGFLAALGTAGGTVLNLARTVTGKPAE